MTAKKKYFFISFKSGAAGGCYQPLALQEIFVAVVCIGSFALSGDIGRLPTTD